jgi:hypothetical protein
MEKPRKIKRDNNYSPGTIDVRLYKNRSTIPYIAPLPLAKSLSLLPEKVIDFVIENYVFISQQENLNGAHFTFDDLYLREKIGFILLFDNLWRKRPMQIALTVAHEVAHAVKGHKTKEVEDLNAEMIIKEEKEADKLAVRWLSKYYKRESLEKLCEGKTLKKKQT